MSAASDIWNALPYEDRARLKGALIERQMLDIEREIKRAKSAHKKHIEDARSQLQNLARSYSEWKREQGIE